MNALGGAPREPLAYPHRSEFGGRRTRLACAHPEDGDWGLDTMMYCPGCEAYGVARAVNHPTMAVHHGGQIISAVEAVRVQHDEFDPMRVLFERALAERGIQ